MNPPMFYFLLALTSVLAATAKGAGGPVLDVDGNPIFDGSYYVLSVFRGAAGGGGLTLAPRGNNQCPLYVGQESSEVKRGIPVRFSNWRSGVVFVPESEDLNIEMDIKATICDQSTYWWVARSDRDSWTWFVEAGPKPESGGDSWRSFFKIKKTGDFLSDYKIVFCLNDNYCIDVGIFVDEYGVRRLALSSTPFPVIFVKATGTETSSKTMSII